MLCGVFFCSLRLTVFKQKFSNFLLIHTSKNFMRMSEKWNDLFLKLKSGSNKLVQHQCLENIRIVEIIKFLLVFLESLNVNQLWTSFYCNQIDSVFAWMPLNMHTCLAWISILVDLSTFPNHETDSLWLWHKLQITHTMRTITLKAVHVYVYA